MYTVYKTICIYVTVYKTIYIYIYIQYAYKTKGSQTILNLSNTNNVDFDSEDSLDVVPGDKVEVIRGPFQGLIATSIEVNRTHKLIVQIESLDQRFVVHVPKSFVKKINA